MPLDEYRRKRQFDRTPEPAGEAKGSRPTGSKSRIGGRSRGKKKAPRPPARRPLRFVIQKHDASRLHYDLRLELDGVLKSWAVPKGPSLDSGEKRLAVQVEDHPLDYANFEGEIPAGEYGAGEVIVWDQGTWTSEKDPHEMFERGLVEFRLEGEKLHGGWILLQTHGQRSEGGKNWLLIKRRDDSVVPLAEGDILAARPESVRSGRVLTIDRRLVEAKSPATTSSNGRKKTAKKSAKKAPRKKVKTQSSAKAPKKSSKEIGGAKPTAATKRSSGAKTRSRTQTAAQRKRDERPDFNPARLPGAKKARLAATVQPQLATLARTTPSGSDWVHEIKFDGYRLLAYIEQGAARLVTRNQLDWTHRYESIAAALSELPVRSALLDGELAALLPSGVSSFQALQSAGRSGVALVYYAFDLLHLDGYDLRAAPLRERKELLAEILSCCTSERLQLSEAFDGDGPSFFRECCRMGLEGAISKRADRPHRAGRSDEWIKTKCVAREELVIGGYTLSTAEKRGFGALLVGYYEGQKLHYAGRVGTGFSTQTLLEMRELLDRRRREASPFVAVPRKERSATTRWVEPELVAQVEFTGWTGDQLLRHPSFQGLREDKPATSVRRPASLEVSPGVAEGKAEAPSEEGTMAKGAKSTKSATRSATAKGTRKKAASASEDAASLLSGVTVSLSSPGRILYDEMGLTKLGLAAHYAGVARWMLPHVVDRPLSLVRCPDGQSRGKCFYQKHVRPGTPPQLRRVEIEEKSKTDEYVCVENLDGLIALVQMSVLEIHPWGARRDRLDRPDRLIIDLDPDENLPWQRVIDAAVHVRQKLTERGITSFLKTTGGKGLHVVFPLAPRRHDWATAKQWCRDFANELAAAEPHLYTTNMSKAARRGKIFVDYLRNDWGSTAIAPYSTRSKPGAPVSTPIEWDELSPALKSDHFHVENLPGRLAALRRDPWEGFLELKQQIDV